MKVGGRLVLAGSTADVVHGPRAARRLSAFNRFAIASLEQSQLALEADGIDVRQVVGQHLDLLALCRRPSRGEIESVVHASASSLKAPPGEDRLLAIRGPRDPAARRIIVASERNDRGTREL